MVRYDRYIEDPDVIAAILDLCDVVHLGLQDRENAYVVPLCFGYHKAEDKLSIFIHTAKEGYALKLIEKNPRVCCSFAQWRNYPHRPYKGHIHDFRSVVAFGTLHRIAPETEAWDTAMQALLRKTNRTECHNPKGMDGIHVFEIVCRWEDVTGKSEVPVRTAADVPFVDVYHVPPDDTPYEDQDLFANKKDQIRSSRFLGYLEK